MDIKQARIDRAHLEWCIGDELGRFTRSTGLVATGVTVTSRELRVKSGTSEPDSRVYDVSVTAGL